MAKIQAGLFLAVAAASPAAAGDMGATSSSTVRISVSVAPRYSLETSGSPCLRSNIQSTPASLDGRPLLPCAEKATAAPTMVETAGERLLIVRAE